MKRIVITAFLTLFFTVSASAGYDFEVDGIYYRIISLSEMTCAVVDSGENDTAQWDEFLQPESEDYSGDIIIPDEVSFKGRTLKVIKIAQGAFFGCRDITSLDIGANVKEIGKYATGVCSIDIVTIKPGNQPLSVDTYGLTGEDIFVGRNMVYKELYASFRKIEFDDSVREIPACPSSFPRYHYKYQYTNYYKDYWDDPVWQTQIITLENKDPEVWTIIIGSGAVSVGDIGKMIITDDFDIIVRAVNPPKAVAFSNKMYVNSALYVPDESVEKYRNAPVWKNFWEILPLSEKPSAQ